VDVHAVPEGNARRWVASTLTDPIPTGSEFRRYSTDIGADAAQRPQQRRTTRTQTPRNGCTNRGPSTRGHTASIRPIDGPTDTSAGREPSTRGTHTPIRPTTNPTDTSACPGPWAVHARSHRADPAHRRQHRATRPQSAARRTTRPRGPSTRGHTAPIRPIDGNATTQTRTTGQSQVVTPHRNDVDAVQDHTANAGGCGVGVVSWWGLA
jgi:hypothetical protein